MPTNIDLQRIAEELYWAVSEHLHALSSSFGGRNYKGMPRRFKKVIHAVDSSIIKLVVNCMDWAKPCRRKAAAKLYLWLNLQSFLPTFAIVNMAKESDSRKAYVDFSHKHKLQELAFFGLVVLRGT